MTPSGPVSKLQAIVAIPTVSSRDPELTPTAEFDRLLATMAELWPRVHSLGVTRAGAHGLLIRWPGREAQRSPEQPVVLMAHLDVVPVVASDWARDPFGADIADGAIWGRGTLDDKGCVAAICEAVESLLARGFVPARDVWLSFGCDEEVTSASARHSPNTTSSSGGTRVRVLRDSGPRRCSFCCSPAGRFATTGAGGAMGRPGTTKPRDTWASAPLPSSLIFIRSTKARCGRSGRSRATTTGWPAAGGGRR